MELRLQPKPEVEIKLADRGIVSWKKYFVKKKFEKINRYFFPGHLIRQWRPKAELIYPPVSDESVIQYECDFNREVQSCFVEDYAEEVYLRSPPPCFVVFGKYSDVVCKICQQIADEYGSVLVNLNEIVSQVLRTDTQSARVLHKIFRLGLPITLNFVLALMSFVAHTPEARHRGYVLCGLPTFSYKYDLSAEQQFDYLFSWINKPTIFINVDFDDEDLVLSRTNTRSEVISINGKTKLTVHTNFITPENEKEEIKKTEGNEDFLEPDINQLPSRPWVQLPMNEELEVWTELEFYENKIKPIIDLIKTRVDPQYYITVDSRVNNCFEVIKARLELLHVWKATMPFSFYPITEDYKSFKKNETESETEREGETEEGEIYLGESRENLNEKVDSELNAVKFEPPQVSFLTLFHKKTLSPKFRWELSHYNYLCPVSLRNGVVVEGKTEFSVVFLKYIYFMSNKESMKKFLQNPRAFVLPVKPKPPCRFIIIGYPFSGKAQLAKSLSIEFSIPIIDVDVITKKDLEAKKKAYQDFCRQKAEAREIIRLTVLAWQNWRKEEDYRLALIEKWIAYIQSILKKRIDQFYSSRPSSDKKDQKKTILPSESSEQSEIEGENDQGDSETRDSSHFNSLILEVRGININRGNQNQDAHNRLEDLTPSEKIIQAMKHKDFDFDDKGLEVEANLFFSNLWNTFSNSKQPVLPERQQKSEQGEFEGEDEDNILRQGYSDDSVSPVNWCNLLPPQSLSSLLLQRTPYTTRQRRKSFQVLLSAASKNYWDPSALKTEFALWRLPCFMDIPLCEVFLDNPLLLYKYCPNWLKERPLIPDPIDPDHPSVIDAGTKALIKSAVVTIRHEKEEIWKLIKDAAEKAEKDGMRVNGEVLSPGGWIIYNIDLEEEIWCPLYKENVVADHVIILLDTEPEHKKIINHWHRSHYGSFQKPNFDSDGRFAYHPSILASTQKSLHKAQLELQPSSLEEIQNIIKLNSSTEKLSPQEFSRKSLFVGMLKASTHGIVHGENELDRVFNLMANEVEEPMVNVPTHSVDPFSYSLLFKGLQTWHSLKEEMSNEELALNMQSLSDSSHNLYVNRKHQSSDSNPPLGYNLAVITSTILNFLNKSSKKEKKTFYQLDLEEELKFFLSLLRLPMKIQRIKDFLKSVNREDTIKEIEVTGKNNVQIFSDFKKSLRKNLIKKPRELTQFEINELMQDLNHKNKHKKFDEEFEYDEGEGTFEEEGEEKEEKNVLDVCIYGESGPFCVVNLERDILLRGKPEYVLRYYGKLYFFWNQKAKDLFMENPEKYAPYYSTIRCLPPLRIFLVGPLGVGKTSLARAVSKQCSIHHIDYITFLNRKLIPHVQPQVDKLTAAAEQKLLLKEDHSENAKLAIKIFNTAPYEKRRYWLENPFDTREDKEQVKAWKYGEINMTDTNFTELQFTNLEGPEEEENDLDEKPTHLSMKEIQEILNNYFQNKGDLPEFCVKKSLSTLWNDEPYVTQGFILDGFPMRESDIQVMEKNNWLPDLVVELSLPESIVLERNLKHEMERWDTRLKQETIEEKLLEETLNSIQVTLASYRRRSLINEKRSEALALWENQSNGIFRNLESKEIVRKSKTSDKHVTGSSILNSKDKHGTSTTTIKSINLPPEIENKIATEVEEIISEEFPPLEFNPVWETYEAGQARIQSAFEECFHSDSEELVKIKSKLRSLGIPWHEMDGAANPRENLIELYMKLNLLKKRVDQKGEHAFTVTMEMADKLLNQGFYFLSKFGKWCPVQVYRMKNPIHMFIPFKKRNKITPIVYRSYIYFVAGENEKNNFLLDPIKYTFHEPHFPNIPLRLAVIGPPKSGKTTLSLRLGYMFSLKVITMGTAIRFVLEKMENTNLHNSIKSYLRRGSFLPLSLKIEALMTCLNDPLCVTQGFVFDGIPFDAAMTQSLAEKGKLPFVIISLTCDPYFGKVNREKLNLSNFRMPYKQRVNLDLRYEEWKETYQRFYQWNLDTYNNVYELNAELGTVEVFYKSYEIISTSYFAIMYYVEYCVTDRALPLQYLCVSQHEYEVRKSEYLNYCPVCWVEVERLNCSTDPPPRSNLVQYLNHFYYICNKHMKIFIEHPKIYFSPHAPECPKLLPKILRKETFEIVSTIVTPYGYGRCPVTRTDFPDSLDWEGSWEYAVSYGDEVYLCKNQEMLERFVARPWRYCDADIEFEVGRPQKSFAVKELEPPVITALPPIGFLEQTVAKLIHEALQVLGSLRPLYPNISPSSLACTFIGLYLKVNNSKKKPTFVEIECLDFMKAECRAHKYRIPPFQKVELEEINFDPTGSESSSSNETEEDDNQLFPRKASRTSRSSRNQSDTDLTFETCWLDLEAQADKKMWSAKFQNPNIFKCFLSGDILEEIKEIPKENVVLKYQSYSLRTNPLPPIPNCLNFIYSCKPSLKLPEPFNINYLFQPEPLFPSPYTSPMYFDPENVIPTHLYDKSKPRFHSDPNIYKGQRYLTEDPAVFTEKKNEKELDLALMRERYVPRFQILDRLIPGKTPEFPTTLEQDVIIYNPQRDYTYTLIMNNFFQSTNFLRCYQWDECNSHFEFLSLHDKNLGLCQVQSQFLFKPKISHSIFSKDSITTHQLALETTNFYETKEELDYKIKSELLAPTVPEKDSRESVATFIQSIISESVDKIVSDVTKSELSYDSYETHVALSSSEQSLKPVIFYREVLPYPPLYWDLISRPYYAFTSLYTIFETPHMDHIAHERHVSLLDGIMEPNDHFKFFRYPTWVNVWSEKIFSDRYVDEKGAPFRRCQKTVDIKRKQKYFFYEFFDFPWTSFLVYPFSWAYNMDIKDNFNENYEPPLHPNENFEEGSSPV